MLCDLPVARIHALMHQFSHLSGQSRAVRDQKWQKVGAVIDVFRVQCVGDRPHQTVFDHGADSKISRAMAADREG
ncbi:hypothetical protein AF72_00975 [Xylella taiwanensis]|uniref:Uncharacterized protein n=1 Tax=Xylella taiwanensis TaxID=1444770 RepID=Z9JN98_9GAMM|nr:hypothetical protein AB672_11145 [Xylella taiwanensis]EWS79468.1 hypothetical protein AF72_00975 [Xylella taiwanensis]